MRRFIEYLDLRRKHLSYGKEEEGPFPFNEQSQCPFRGKKKKSVFVSVCVCLCVCEHKRKTHWNNTLENIILWSSFFSLTNKWTKDIYINKPNQKNGLEFLLFWRILIFYTTLAIRNKYKKVPLYMQRLQPLS